MAKIKIEIPQSEAEINGIREEEFDEFVEFMQEHFHEYMAEADLIGEYAYHFKEHQKEEENTDA